MLFRTPAMHPTLQLGPRAIRREVEGVAQHLSSGVGFALSVWSGQGHWEFADASYRAQEGRKALPMLDEAIASLTDLRAQLAAALDESTDPNATTAPDHNRRGDAGPADAPQGTPGDECGLCAVFLRDLDKPLDQAERQGIEDALRRHQAHPHRMWKEGVC